MVDRRGLQVELAQQVVVLGHGALALEDLDQDSRLVVCVRGERLGLRQKRERRPTALRAQRGRRMRGAVIGRARGVIFLGGV